MDDFLNPSTRPRGHLLAHIMRFGRLLRLMGVTVSLNQLLELARAVEYVHIIHKADFYATARTMLIVRHEDYSLFDQAFRLYWRTPEPLSINNQTKKDNRPQEIARLPSLLAAVGT